MDGARFDAIARHLGRSISRRRFLGGVAGAAAVAALPIRFASAQVDAADAKTTVEQFYQYLAVYDYASAYALLGASWQQTQSEKTFVTGYAGTAFVQLKVTGTADASAGKNVNVELTSWHNDASVQAFSGSYTVGSENGKNVLLSADITQSAKPNVSALCTLDDLDISLGGGDAGAGSRFGTIIGQNVSSSACVLGGAPRFIIRDQTTGNRLISTSEPGSPATGIVLQPAQSGSAQFRFSNWCGANPPSSFSVGVEVAGDSSETIVTAGLDQLSFPPCLGSGESALLGVQGWTAS